MGIFGNIDLFSVGFAIAATGILGIVVFLNNRKSITNKMLFIFSICAILWSASNYLSYQFTDPSVVLWILRGNMFFAIWYTFFMFSFFYVFPEERKIFSWRYKYLITPLAIITALICLSPWIFVKIGDILPGGGAANVVNGPGILLFGPVVIGLLISGIVIFLQKMKAIPVEKKIQYRLTLLGLSMTFLLHIIFNFVFPAALNITRFIPYSALYTFPFIFFTSYAIFRHGLLNVKVIGTEVLVFVLVVASLVDVVVATDIKTIMVRVGVFLLTFVVGAFLIRSVHKEVEQREKLQKLTEDLEKVNEELKKTEKLKAEFFSFAAHQVKSPMAVIKGYATLIGDGTLAGVPMDKIAEIAKKISTAASRTLSMVNNLLDMRKIEEGRMVYSFEQTDVVAPIRMITCDLETLAKDRGLALTFEASQDEIILNMDIQKFTQVIQNLIDNAVKYTETGWIKVAVKLNDGKVLFTVSDSGRGISKEFADKMFSQFARDPALAQDTKGTGLGLFIAKQIVEAHGGRIWASSEGEGSGSTFSVEIPMDNAVATAVMGN